MLDVYKSVGGSTELAICDVSMTHATVTRIKRTWRPRSPCSFRIGPSVNPRNPLPVDCRLIPPFKNYPAPQSQADYS
jgi:hypothetical protein